MKSIPQDNYVQLSLFDVSTNKVFHKKRYPPVEITCHFCGLKSIRYASQAKGTIQFCNKDCHAAYQKACGQPPHLLGYGSKPAIHMCEMCGTITTKRRPKDEKHKHTFCSKQCYGKWRSDHPLGKRHPLYQPDSVGMCTYCGNITHKAAWELRRHERIFCNKTCYEAWQSAQSHAEERSCVICGKIKRYDLTKITRNKNFCCSKECSDILLSIQNSGENHWNWRGGAISYYGPNWKSQRRKARKRDSYKCQQCGIPEKDLGQELDVHHIVDFRHFGVEKYKEANDLSNLVSLCHHCHILITNGVATWPPTEQSA